MWIARSLGRTRETPLGDLARFSLALGLCPYPSPCPCPCSYPCSCPYAPYRLPLTSFSSSRLPTRYPLPSTFFRLISLPPYPLVPTLINYLLTPHPFLLVPYPLPINLYPLPLTSYPSLNLFLVPIRSKSLSLSVENPPQKSDRMKERRKRRK